MTAGPSRIIGRYALYGKLASGGMATVYVGRLLGPVGFSRTVAIKRLHPQFAKDPEFASMFLDEARLAARVRHPNVVATLDVVAHEGELLLVLDYVAGDTLARLAPAGGPKVPLSIVSGVMTAALHGLHGAHEATSDTGEPLEIVHRDVSPQNIIVGVDGVPRVLDFGVAKATGRSQHTREGVLKGKIAYMPPEQIKSAAVDRRVDVYAAAVVMWELLAGQRLFDGDDEWQLARRVVAGATEPPSSIVPDVPRELDAIVMRGLSVRADDRFPTALAMAEAIERVVPPATAREVAAWVVRVGGDSLRQRMDRVADVESGSGDLESSVTAPMKESSSREVAALPAGTRKVALPGALVAPADDEITREVAHPRAALPPAPLPAPLPALLPAPSPSPPPAPAVTPQAVSTPTSHRAAIAGGVAIALVAAFAAGRMASPDRAPVEARPEAPPRASAPLRSSETASVVAAPPPAEPASASAAPSASTVTAPRRPAARSDKVDCRTPYRIDDQGIKRLRPECL